MLQSILLSNIRIHGACNGPCRRLLDIIVGGTPAAQLALDLAETVFDSLIADGLLPAPPTFGLFSPFTTYVLNINKGDLTETMTAAGDFAYEATLQQAQTALRALQHTSQSRVVVTWDIRAAPDCCWKLCPHIRVSFSFISLSDQNHSRHNRKQLIIQLIIQLR